jgi:hypothetical protein
MQRVTVSDLKSDDLLIPAVPAGDGYYIQRKYKSDLSRSPRSTLI